jgi:hypothetical protein
MHCGRRERSWLTAWLSSVGVGALLALSQPARAQMCEDDGGLVCGEDGGMDPRDEDGGAGTGGSGGTGPSAGMGGKSGSGMDAGSDDADACSCRATIDDEQGRIDVCTQGNTRSACARFDCERGIVRDQLCARSDIRLCCVMEDRDLVSVLYNDCTHANCVAGFTQQCHDFNGTLRDRDCEQVLYPDSDDDSDEGDGCSVARSSGRGQWLGLVLAFAVVLVQQRKRKN